MLAPVLVTPPAAFPVTLAEVKEFLRVDFEDQDKTIKTLIAAATGYLDGRDGILGRALINQTWRLDGYSFWDEPWRDENWNTYNSYSYGYGGGGDASWSGRQRLRLSPAPVSAVTYVKYYDADNVQQTLSTSVYQLLNDRAGPYIVLKPNQSWPTSYYREDAVQVTFVAGYGPDPLNVPGPLRQAILLLIGHWFENREQVITGLRAVAIEVPFAVHALTDPFRIRSA